MEFEFLRKFLLAGKNQANYRKFWSEESWPTAKCRETLLVRGDQMFDSHQWCFGGQDWHCWPIKLFWTGFESNAWSVLLVRLKTQPVCMFGYLRWNVYVSQIKINVKLLSYWNEFCIHISKRDFLTVWKPHCGSRQLHYICDRALWNVFSQISPNVKFILLCLY